MKPVTVTFSLTVLCRTLVELQSSYREMLVARENSRRYTGRNLDVFDSGLRQIGEAIVALDIARRQWASL